MSKIPLAVLLAGLLTGVPALAQPGTSRASDVPPRGGLTYYATRADFDADHPDFFVEDFEDVNVSNGISCWCTSPVDWNTDNDCYDPQTLRFPLGLAAVGPTQFEFDALIALGPGYFGQPSIVVGANLEVDTTVVRFGSGVEAVGMEVYAYFGNPGIMVDIYDYSGALLGSTTVPGDTTGTFFGVRSDGALIGAVHLDADEDYTLLDDIAYPLQATPGVEPPAEAAPLLDFTVHPNPLHGTGTVTLTLARPQPVVLSVHDGLGRRVALVYAGELNAGFHAFRLDGSRLPSGTYLVRLAVGDEIHTRQVTLVR